MIVLSVLSTMAGGCASTQLNHNTLDLASTVGDLQTQQVLYNLSLIMDNPGAIPTHVDLTAGSSSTTNSITPTITTPFTSSAQILAQGTTTLNGAGGVVSNANELQNLGTSTRNQS